MKYGEFMAALRRDGMRQVFLLAGEEHYYIEKAEKRLLKLLFADKAEQEEGLQTFSSDVSLGELTGLLETVPFFSTKNVVLVRNAAIFGKQKEAASAEEGAKKKTAADKALDRFIELLGDLPETNYVIFELTAKPDKRRRLYKAVEKAGLVLDEAAVEPWSIGEWLREKLMELDRRFDAAAMEYFTGAVSLMRPVPLEFLDQELDKLALYTDKKVLSRRDLEKMLSALPEVSQFALIEAVSSKNLKQALTILERQLAEGAYLPVIIAMLFRQVRQLMLARYFMSRGITGKQLAGPLGGGKPINAFIAEKIGRAARGFSDNQLRTAVKELADADYSLKQGKAGPEVLEHLIIGLCRCEGA